MEMKVWMEGIQRVVCGVDEHTTCHDLILAMAHATGRTGRFAMIEKWRGKERRLSPTDNPVRILQKWGEYATDIQFILRHSSSGKRPVGSIPARGPGALTSQLGEIPSSLEVNGQLRKSRTFSGAHACDFVFKPHARVRGIENDGASSTGRHGIAPVHVNNSVESSEQSSITSRSSASISPYPSLERRLPRRTVTGFEIVRAEQSSVSHKGFTFKNQRSPLTFVDNYKCDGDITPIALIKPNKLTCAGVSKERRTDFKSHVNGVDRSVNLDRSGLQCSPTTTSFDTKSKKIPGDVPCVSHTDKPLTDYTNGVVRPSLLPDRATSANVLKPISNQHDSKSKSTSFGFKVSSVTPKTSAAVSTSTVVRSSSSVTSQHSQSLPKLVESTSTDAVKSLSSRFLVNSLVPREERASGSSQGSVKSSTKIPTKTDAGKTPAAKTPGKTDAKVSDDNRSTSFAEARANFLNRETDEILSTQEKDSLVELCREQKEELRSYESELEALAAALSAAQQTTSSSETQRQTALSQIEELDQEERLLDAELLDLELVSWEDKRSIEQQRSTRMTTELAMLKSSVSRSDKDIARLEENNRHLAAEIDSLTTLRHQGLVDKNSNLMVLEDLKNELAKARERHAQSKELLSIETQQVVITQQSVSDKQTALDSLQDVLKEANLNLFKLESAHSCEELHV